MQGGWHRAQREGRRGVGHGLDADELGAAGEGVEGEMRAPGSTRKEKRGRRPGALISGKRGEGRRGADAETPEGDTSFCVREKIGRVRHGCGRGGLSGAYELSDGGGVEGGGRGV